MFEFGSFVRSQNHKTFFYSHLQFAHIHAHSQSLADRFAHARTPICIRNSDGMWRALFGIVASEWASEWVSKWMNVNDQSMNFCTFIPIPPSHRDWMQKSNTFLLETKNTTKCVYSIMICSWFECLFTPCHLTSAIHMTNKMKRWSKRQNSRTIR